MDRTITRSGTYAAWLRHWVATQAPWRAPLMPLTALTGAGFLVRAYDRGPLKVANQRMLMGGRVDAEKVERAAHAFAEKVVPAHCFDAALKRLQTERAEGRRIMIATASYDFYVRALARKFRAEDVIATDAVRDGGDILAQIDGENCYGQAKLHQVQAYLDDRGLNRSECHVRFFSDHISDLPTLEWADEAIVVNPKGRLKRLAEMRQWARMEW